MGAKYGQHFLTDKTALDKIVSYLDLKNTERVLEIGPGKGVLTERLLEQAEMVKTIEIDPEMAKILQERFTGNEKFSLTVADFLKFDLDALPPGSPWVVAGNLPYNLTSPILRRLSDWAGWSRACVMVQKEMGDRLTAKVGTGEYGAITVGMSLTCQLEKVFDLPPGAFRPPPKVRSSVIGLFRRAEPLTPHGRITQRIIQAAFQQRRKTILNSLSHGLGIKKETTEETLVQGGFKPQTRPERLSPDDFVSLTNIFLAHLT